MSEDSSWIGKIPPQNVELEEAILGALMVDSECYFRVGHELKAEMFYKSTHQLIYDAIKTFEGVGCDLYTVISKMKELKTLDQVGGPYALTQIVSKVASSAHIEFHLKKVDESYKARECIRVSNAIQMSAYESSLEDVARYDMELNSVLFGSKHLDLVSVKDSIDEAFENIMNVVRGTKDIIGIPTGFQVLDRFLYGLQSPDLFIIAARPSMGKTALALAMARNIAATLPVHFFSLEMSGGQLNNRLLSMESRIDSHRFKTKGGLNPLQMEQLMKARDVVGNLNLHVDDTPAIHINDLKSKARRAHRIFGTKVIFVDHIQLARGTANNRDQEISQITQGLKAIAKELDVPVIALSQLNRQVENRAGRRPNLSDLRESGAIEADADVVAFVHRPERYKITEFSDGTSTEGLAEIIIEKNRNGAVGDLVMRFIGGLTLFEDVELDELESSKVPSRDRNDGSNLFSTGDDDYPF